MQTTSTITCPHCGNKSTETMAADACQFFYICNECKTQLRPLLGIAVSSVHMQIYPVHLNKEISRGPLLFSV
jgi:DNA-directed RNA polymerase subunit RPC12/RpoP